MDASCPPTSHLLLEDKSDLSIGPELTLQQRDPNEYMAHLGFGWAQTFQEFNSWLPARTAISTLESFYKGMLYNAQIVWPVASPSQALLVRQGALTFRLYCDKQPIPWSMVKDIVKVFLDATELGFNGRYEGKFVYLGTAATITTIYVSLKVNPLQTI
ncbi:MAG: hypothetical protein Q9191_001937 [Dirinaria sp. TL-2023a]